MDKFYFSTDISPPAFELKSYDRFRITDGVPHGCTQHDLKLARISDGPRPQPDGPRLVGVHCARLGRIGVRLRLRDRDQDDSRIASIVKTLPGVKSLSFLAEGYPTTTPALEDVDVLRLLPPTVQDV